MPVYTIHSSPVSLVGNTPSSISWSIPTDTNTWCYATLSLSGAVYGSGNIVARVYSSESQMYMVSAGEKVGNELEAGTINKNLLGWNGLDDSIHPIFNMLGQIWSTILSSKGGTLNLNIKIMSQNRTGINNDYYTWEVGTAPISGTVVGILSIYYGAGESAPTPSLTKVQIRHSVGSRPNDPVAVAASLLRYNEYYYPEGQWIAVETISVDGLKLLDRYNIAINGPHPESGVGCVILPSGRVIISYEDHSGVIKYLYNDNHAITTSVAATGTMSIPTTVWIKHYTSEWTDAGDLRWPSASLIDSCHTPAGVVALFTTVTSGKVLLHSGLINNTGECVSSTVIASGISGGTDVSWYDHVTRTSEHGGLAGITWSPHDVLVSYKYGSQAYILRCGISGEPQNLRLLGTISSTNGTGAMKALNPYTSILLSGGVWCSHDRGNSWSPTTVSGNGASAAYMRRLMWSQRQTWTTLYTDRTWIVPQTHSYAYTDDFGKTWNTGTW